jgi:thymidylate kinase
MRHAVPRAPQRASALRRIPRIPARLRRLRRERGLSVAIIGPDGAGKSTLVDGLARSLPLPTMTQYMGLTGGRLLPKADALRVPGVVFAARIAILWARYLRGWYHRARGEIVLFERYTLDGAVPSGMRLSLAGCLSRRVQRRACPMPDLVLLLDAPGSTLHERSGEYDATVLEGWRSAFGRLRSSVPALEVIDAEQPPEMVRREAEARIWRRYSELRSARHGRRSGR